MKNSLRNYGKPVNHVPLSSSELPPTDFGGENTVCPGMVVHRLSSNRNNIAAALTGHHENVLGPTVEGVALFVEAVVAVVCLLDAGREITEDGFGGPLVDVKARHSGPARSAQIVKGEGRVHFFSDPPQDARLASERFALFPTGQNEAGGIVAQTPCQDISRR